MNCSRFGIENLPPEVAALLREIDRAIRRTSIANDTDANAAGVLDEPTRLASVLEKVEARTGDLLNRVRSAHERIPRTEIAALCWTSERIGWVAGQLFAGKMFQSAALACLRECKAINDKIDRETGSDDEWKKQRA
jgi:hypothetical protein